MPPAKKPARCQAREEGRRCYRKGTGDPPLCRTHKLALGRGIDLDGPLGQLADQADRWLRSREGRDTVAAAAGNMLDRFLDHFSVPRRPQVPAPSPKPPPTPAPAESRPDPIKIARIILHFGPDEPLTKEKIKERQRLLAGAVHPDKGGDTSAMQRINQAADVLCHTLP